MTNHRAACDYDQAHWRPRHIPYDVISVSQPISARMAQREPFLHCPLCKSLPVYFAESAEQLENHLIYNHGIFSKNTAKIVEQARADKQRRMGKTLPSVWFLEEQKFSIPRCQDCALELAKTGLTAKFRKNGKNFYYLKCCDKCFEQ